MAGIRGELYYFIKSVEVRKERNTAKPLIARVPEGVSFNANIVPTIYNYAEVHAGAMYWVPDWLDFNRVE